MKRLLLVLFLASALLCARADELLVCGDGICSLSESRSSCPSDCCLTSSDHACSWSSECGGEDPDCCVSGACFSTTHVCTDEVRGESCYPGMCVSGACISTCASFTTCPSGFCGTECSPVCIPDGGVASDFESCCACFQDGACEACHSLGVKGSGFLVYRERETSIPIELYDSSVSVTDVSISVSGPLKNYVTLGSSDRVWTGAGFTRINPLEVKSFTLALKDVPQELVGMYSVKLSMTYSGGATSHMVWVAVLPVSVGHQGREPPSQGTVGVSRSIMGMEHEDGMVPVEVVVEVW